MASFKPMDTDRKGRTDLNEAYNEAACANGGLQAQSGRDRPGALIVNADDWGRDLPTSNRTLECVSRGVVSSVSAMVFMQDSERAADLAREHGVDAGLHLNFTLRYNGSQVPHRLLEHQEKVARFASSHWWAPVVFHPGLVTSFEYVSRAQQEEYERLYGFPANRMDGHHHMHLCANVIFQKLIPAGTIVRRNFTFRPGEKGYFNRLYRRWQDRLLARRHRLADLLFDLHTLNEGGRLARITELATHFDVELEAHPMKEEEYRFLVDGELTSLADKVEVARGYTLHSKVCGAPSRSVL
jgi:hypothetical protein